MTDRNGVEIRVGDRVLVCRAVRDPFFDLVNQFAVIVPPTFRGVGAFPVTALISGVRWNLRYAEVELPVVAAVARRRENEVKHG